MSEENKCAVDGCDNASLFPYASLCTYHYESTLAIMWQDGIAVSFEPLGVARPRTINDAEIFYPLDSEENKCAAEGI